MMADLKLIKANKLTQGTLIDGKTILNLTKVQTPKKVTVYVEEGTILANGVLTTTIYGDYRHSWK